MKVIILAGGLGTRLGNLTKNTPKPMIRIGRKSVLQHIVDRLHKHELKQIIVKVHYLPNKIMEGIGDKVLYYYEPVLFNWSETIKNLTPWLEDDDFMVINGDTISEVDFTKMIALHRPGTITELRDDNRAMGTWIYSKEYFKNPNLPIYPYRPNVAWFDIGKPDRLEAARKHFVKGEKQLCP